MTQAIDLIPDDHPHGWRRYVYATNHRDVGVMTLWLAVLAGLIGGAASLLPRAELMESGLLMASFAALAAMLGGFGNSLVPLMIGAPGTAFPRLGAAGFWLMGFALVLLLLSLPVDGGAGSVPLAAAGSPGPAADFVIAALFVAAAATVFTAINLITTILNLRTPGMTLAKMPLTVWSVLVAAILLLLSMPVLAATVTMLLADRHFGTAFFRAAAGGDPQLLRNLWWFFAHPAAVALILPGIGMVAQVASALAARPVPAGRPLVAAMTVLGVLSFLLWAIPLTGAILSAVPAVVIVAALAGALRGGASRRKTPLLFAAAFVLTLAVGLSALVLAAAAPHIYAVLAAAALFALFAGWYFWFPKLFGWLVNETLAKIHFWLTFAGVGLAFLPSVRLGLGGGVADPGWTAVTSLATFAAGAGVIVFVIVLAEAFAKKREAGDNPWGDGAATLEWTQSSPPPYHSFNAMPKTT